MKVKVLVGLMIGFIFSYFIFPEFNGQIRAQNKKTEEKIEKKWEVLNRYNRQLGSIDASGNVFNRNGKYIGSVDTSGTVFNISEIMIGHINGDGTVFNQSKTILGAVDVEGNIFNRNDRKIGSVEGCEEINLTGGAARLLLF